jgi:hypothetical protein
MVEISKETFVAPALGIGTKDYSTTVEGSVEPLTISWQDEYREYEEITVPAGESRTVEIQISAATVVIPYDFYLSTYSNVLLQLELEFFTAEGAWAPFASKMGVRTVDIRLSKGWPLFLKYRLIVTNYDAILDADCVFTAHGVVTSENEYYGRISP